MSKDIAVISGVKEDRLLACIQKLGFTFENPLTKKVYGFPADGSDRVVLSGTADAIAFLRRGGGIQFWKDGAEDLFLTYRPDDGFLRLFFDGYTEEETESMKAGLTKCGIKFEIEYDY